MKSAADALGTQFPRFLVAMTLLAFFTEPAKGENWPWWRGPNRDGISTEKNLPLHWGPKRNIDWKVSIPGRGHSSPIVWGDSIFVSSCIEEERRRILLRIDRNTGKTIWMRTVLTSPLEGIHKLNSFSSSTPATDGEQIYVTFLDQSHLYVAAYDFAGNKLWERRPGEFYSRHGFCTNPVIYKDELILNGDHDGESYIVMLQKETGQTVWKTPRQYKTRSYNTPIILEIDGRDQLVMSGSLTTAGFDIQTGKRIWVCDGPSEQMVATLVHSGDLIFSLGGFPERHLLAIRKGGSGEITDTHIVWRTSRSIPYVPSPLLYGDLLHVISDKGIYTCFDPPTGAVHVTKRISDHVSSSMVAAEGHVYLTDDVGQTIVFENSANFAVIATNQLGEEIYSSPAISQGSLFFRGLHHLFRIGP